MCCTNANSEKAVPDEDEDTFERIEELNHLEEQNDEDDEASQIADLEKELALAKLEIQTLTDRKRGYKLQQKIFKYAVVLFISILGITRIPPPLPRGANIISSSGTKITPDATPKCECLSERFDVSVEYHNDFTYGFGLSDGYITEIEHNSNAEKAGLQVGDEILTVNGQDITGRVEWGIYDLVCDPAYHYSDKVYRSIRGFYPEDCLALKDSRDGRKLGLHVRRSPAGYKRLQAATLRYFQFGMAAATGVVLAFLIACFLFIYICRIFSALVFGSGKSSKKTA